MTNERVLPGLAIKGFADKLSDDWHLWADENWRMLAMRSGGWVKSRTTALPGSGTTGDVFIVPSGAGSNPNKVAVWDGASGSEAWVYYTPQEGWAFWVRDEDKVYHWDGTAWVLFTGGVDNFPDLGDTPAAYTDQAGKFAAVKTAEDGLEFKATPYDVPVVKGGTPTANEVIARFTLARGIDFPADFASSQGTVETNPDASFAIDVQDDGVSIGTITVSTAGAYTFTTAGGTAKTVAAGSKLEFVGPDPADASVAGISFMLRGSTVDL